MTDTPLLAHLTIFLSLNIFIFSRLEHFSLYSVSIFCLSSLHFILFLFVGRWGLRGVGGDGKDKAGGFKY